MRNGQTKQVWTKEEKLKIVHKHLDEHIPIKQLGKEYGIILQRDSCTPTGVMSAPYKPADRLANIITCIGQYQK